MIKRKKEELISTERTLELEPDDFEGLSSEDILVGASSILGTRESQQDALYVYKSREKKFAVAIVCDGMGGLNGGELASSTAVDYLRQKIDEDIEEDDIREELYKAVGEADFIVRDLESEEGNPLNAGTTMVMAVIKKGFINWVSVGDSKIYLIRNNQVFHLTNEHNYSFMAEKKKDDNTFKFNPQVRQDALVSYLGAGQLPYIDINQAPVKLLDEDIIVLCSDGLYKNLSEEQIKVLFLSEDRDMERAAQMLTMAASMDAGESQDNTTVVVLKYKNEMLNHI